jgi:CheY-like chemotaxis protein
MGARILVVDDSPTIRKVVSSILEARDYQATVAEDGEEALDRLAEESFDLVLLDFVMPRMNGYQFCRELRAREHLKSVPIVLMSAKGDRIREQFVQQTGAIDAITKPFDARGLIAVVEGALRRRETGKAPPVTMAAELVEEEALLESRPSRAPLDFGTSGGQSSSAVLAELSSAIATELVHAKLLATASDPRVRQAIERAFTPAVLETITAASRSANQSNAREVLAGDISVISIAEVLQMLQMQRQNGSLEVTSREQRVTLHVREGNVDLAASRGLPEEFLLGRYLVRDRVLTRENLEHVLEQGDGSERLLGERLVDAGLATPDQIRTALVVQTSELVYEVVRWNKGRFAFRVGDLSATAAAAKLGLSVGGLVMEGFRRVDEWRMIEGTFDFDEVLYRDEGAIQRLTNDSQLTPQERAVLSAIDGERTVREVVDEVSGSSFELCKVLYQFLNSRLVRRKAA